MEQNFQKYVWKVYQDQILLFKSLYYLLYTRLYLDLGKHKHIHVK